MHCLDLICHKRRKKSPSPLGPPRRMPGRRFSRSSRLRPREKLTFVFLVDGRVFGFDRLLRFGQAVVPPVVRHGPGCSAAPGARKGCRGPSTQGAGRPVGRGVLSQSPGRSDRSPRPPPKRLCRPDFCLTGYPERGTPLLLLSAKERMTGEQREGTGILSRSSAARTTPPPHPTSVENGGWRGGRGEEEGAAGSSRARVDFPAPPPPAIPALVIRGGGRGGEGLRLAAVGANVSRAAAVLRRRANGGGAKEPAAASPKGGGVPSQPAVGNREPRRHTRSFDKSPSWRIRKVGEPCSPEGKAPPEQAPLPHSLPALAESPSSNPGARRSGPALYPRRRPIGCAARAGPARSDSSPAAASPRFWIPRRRRRVCRDEAGRAARWLR